MIRVRKSERVPLSLTTTIAYNGEDVKEQLLTDHDSKCYLCESILVTDFQVEHHKSQNNHPELRQEWSNLFLVCSYCNGKKSDKYDDITYPVLKILR